MTEGERGPIIFGIDRAAPGSSDKSMMVEMEKLPHGQWKIVSIGEVIEGEVVPAGRRALEEGTGG